MTQNNNQIQYNAQSLQMAVSGIPRKILKLWN